MSPSKNSRNLVILGMHRSGTSMIAGALAEAGLRAGTASELMDAQEDNPRGFWERYDVVALNDALLEKAGASWFDPRQLCAASAVDHEQEMADIVQRLGGQGWMLKDPRLAFTLPAWEGALDDTFLVYVYRDPVSVASSLERRNGLPLDFGLALWERYNRQILSLLEGREFVALSYEQFSQNPVPELGALIKQLNRHGFELAEASDEAESAFDPGLDHSRAAGSGVADLMTASQRELQRQCLSVVEHGELELPVAPPEETLITRITSMARAHGHAVDSRQLSQELAEKTGQMAATLSQLHATEKKLKEVHAAEIAGRADRDKLLLAHDELIDEHHALAKVHKKDNEELAELRDVAVELAEVQAKADYLFHQLDHSYHQLLAYADSGLGKLQAFILTCYKTFTLRRGLSTAYEDILSDARVHFADYDQQLPQGPASKFGLLMEVLQYVRANPSGSRRSFSLSRLKRALSVFWGADRDDLEVWVNQRFPTQASLEAQSVMPDLGPDMDTLELSFPQSEAPRVSIVIPVYNQYRMTLFCLQSVLEHSSDVEYEIILADDASSDLTASIGDRVSGMVIERAAQNRGFVRNCNAGATHARGEFVLFLNNDTGVTRGWLSSLVRILDERPSAGVVGPKLLFGSGELQEAGGIVWEDASGWNYGRMDDPGKPEYNYVKETDYVSGACLLIRTGLWQQLGGFDERYVPAYYEDTDICFAARDAGYSVLYQPASRVFHFEGVSNGTDLGSGIKQYQVENRVKFQEKWQLELQRDHFPNAECVFQARDRSRSRRTVLVIDHYVPSFDKDAGSRSTWQYLQLLVEMGYNVKFVGANFFPHKPYTQALQQLGVEVLVGEYIARHFDSWLTRHAADIHTVYIHRPHVAEQFLESLERLEPRPTLIFFGHDLHYLRKQREQEISGSRTAQKESADWRSREFKLFEHMDHIYYPSQVEIDEIRAQAPQLPLEAIPLYVVDDAPMPEYSAEDRRGMLFVGGFNHPPNADGIAWFVDEVLPLVRKEDPDLELHIVGSNIPTEIQALTSAGVVVHGYLTDEALLALYQKIQLVVVPLRYGAGVKGKVVEAIQQGVPVVTTSIGAEGLPNADAVLHIADDSAGFAQCVLSVVSDDQGTTGKLTAYPDYLEDNFSKSKAGRIIRRDFGEPVLEVPCV